MSTKGSTHAQIKKGAEQTELSGKIKIKESVGC
jgi:hypothetical protein